MIAPAKTYKPHEWKKPHRPPGSTLASGRRPAATGDYQRGGCGETL
jgi:hypothetical protein